MQSRAALASLTGVALIIGLLLVAQLRSQARPTEISTLSAQDLSTLIETLSTRNNELSCLPRRRPGAAARVPARGGAGPERP